MYDRLLDRIAFGNAAYYDNMRGDGKSALELATAAAEKLNEEYREKRMKEMEQKKR